MIYANGGGAGLMEAAFQGRRQASALTCAIGARAVALLRGANGVEGVRVRSTACRRTIRAQAVVLACGGFEANREWRARYLGPGWDMAKVRGTRYNTGDGIRMALDIGAQSYGQWSGCHSVRLGAQRRRLRRRRTATSGLPAQLSVRIMVNADGKRFVDEGADFRNFTYAKYGRVMLQQPGGYAWQVFDAQVKPLMRDEYKLRGATKVQRRHARGSGHAHAGRRRRADSSRPCASSMPRSSATCRSIPTSRTAAAPSGLALDKSNWANTLEKPPFEAYSVGCGITFTFGGLKIDTTGMCSTSRIRRCPGSMPRASWSAASSISTIPAPPG